MKSAAPLQPPRVSVVIAVKNGEKTIARAVRSAASQTLREIEILVVDDASEDGTHKLLAAIEQDDARVRVWRNTTNLGPSESRNIAISQARGEWIALLDADDAFAADRLAALLACREADAVEMLSDNVMVFPEGHAPYVMIPADELKNKLMTFEAFMQGCFWRKGRLRSAYVFLKPLLRREFLQNKSIAYNVNMRNGEDFDLYIRCYLAGARWSVVDIPTYLYSLKMGSQSDNIRPIDRSLLAGTLQEAMIFAKTNNEQKLHDLCRTHWVNIRSDRTYLEFKEAVRNGKLRGLVKLLFYTRSGLRDITVNLFTRSRISPKIMASKLFDSKRS